MDSLYLTQDSITADTRRVKITVFNTVDDNAYFHPTLNLSLAQKLKHLLEINWTSPNK
jgi:hypothetical protein